MHWNKNNGECFINDLSSIQAGDMCSSNASFLLRFDMSFIFLSFNILPRIQNRQNFRYYAALAHQNASHKSHDKNRQHSKQQEKIKTIGFCVASAAAIGISVFVLRKQSKSESRKAFFLLLSPSPNLIVTFAFMFISFFFFFLISKIWTSSCTWIER